MYYLGIYEWPNRTQNSIVSQSTKYSALKLNAARVLNATGSVESGSRSQFVKSSDIPHGIEHLGGGLLAELMELLSTRY